MVHIPAQASEFAMRFTNFPKRLAGCPFMPTYGALPNLPKMHRSSLGSGELVVLLLVMVSVLVYVMS